MDETGRCIKRGMHITDDEKLLNATWNDFIDATRERKVIIYGVNNNLRLLFERCPELSSVVAVIDNDANKQKYTLGDLFDSEDVADFKTIMVTSSDALAKYNPNKTVVFISSFRYYREIIKNISAKGFSCYFSLINLEYNYRKSIRFDESVYFHEYAVDCTKRYNIVKNKIVFYGQGSYADHEKYICERLLEMKLPLDIVWITDNLSAVFPKEVRTVYAGKKKECIYEMETAQMWIFDGMVNDYLVKRKGQIYIQTKHWGSITLKKFYLDSASINTVADNLTAWKKNSEWIDFIIVGSKFDEESCKRGFGFNGKFLWFGSPRSDAMFQRDKYKQKMCAHFNLSKDIKILLYAPTYRFRDGKGEIFDFEWLGLDLNLLLSVLRSRWGGDWVVLVRMHPMVKDRIRGVALPDNVINVSDYDDGQELAAASDIMISDFSSFMFEPAYVGIPVFLYAPDKDRYETTDYELLLDCDELPFPLAMDNESLLRNIKDFNEVNYEKKVKSFLKKYGVSEDGKAAERAANFVSEMINTNQWGG